MTIRTFVIGVSYKSDLSAKQFASAWALNEDFAKSGRTIIVLNGADDDRTGPLRDLARLPTVSLVTPPCNLGYFTGAQWALDPAVATWGMPEWIIISNCDIVPDVTSVLDGLRRYDQLTPLTSQVIGPAISLVPHGRPHRLQEQNPYLLRRPSRRSIRTLKWIAESRFRMAMYEFISMARYSINNRLRRSQASDSPYDVYSVFGAFLILHRSFFDLGARLTYPPLIFGEELFLAETARSMDFRITFDPSMRVFHKEHVSTGGLSGAQRARFTSRALSFNYEQFFRLA